MSHLHKCSVCHKVSLRQFTKFVVRGCSFGVVEASKALLLAKHRSTQTHFDRSIAEDCVSVVVVVVVYIVVYLARRLDSFRLF